MAVSLATGADTVVVCVSVCTVYADVSANTQSGQQEAECLGLKV